jgi:PAS domain S-box-containing protein
MSWLTVIWSMAASACLTLALMHLAIWVKQRSNLSHLLFSVAATAVAGVAAGELKMMLAQTPEQFGMALRWVHLPICILIISLVGFVRVYFGSGRTWLGGLVCGIRLLLLIVNFSVWPNLNYKVITGLRHVPMFGGETAAVAIGVPSPWTRLGQLASILFLIFVIDASIGLWKRGGPRERQRAWVIGGSLTFFVLAAACQSILVLEGIIAAPYLISFPFLVPLIAMGYALGSDVVRAARLARELQTSRSQLRASEQQMNLVTSAADLGLWEWDVESDRVWMAERTREILSIDRTDKLNLNRFLGMLHSDDREPVRKAVTKSLHNGGDYEAEYRVRLADGRYRWVAARGKVHFNGGGKPLLMRGVSIDITQRRQAEEHFRLVVEAAPNAMIMVNPRGIVTLVNAQAEAIFGYTREEMVGHPIEMLIPERWHSLHPDHRAGYFSVPTKRSMGADRDLFGRRKDGSEVPVEIGLNPIQAADGMFVLASIIDITQRRRAEREATMQRNELAHLSRVTMLGELSGSLAHELNQPLTAILSNAQAAQRFLTNDAIDRQEVQEILKDIIAADNRAGETIHRLRMLFKNGEVQNQPVDVIAMVREVLKFLNSDLINHEVVVNTNLEGRLPEVHVDRVQMQQVLINLIVNACDAMAGTVPSERRLMVRAERPNGDDEVHISICDSGCGIASERLEAVFEPFVTTKAQGMGLGLAVCRTIVSAHGGKLWATNNPDRGATFHLTLPALRAVS